MARQVLPWVGGAIGAYVGGPAGFQVGYALGTVIGNEVDPVINQGPRLGELPTQTSNEGQAIAIIYGTAPCTGTIASFSEVRKTTVITEGEKGSGPKTESEVALRSWNIIICEGEIRAVLCVIENDKLVYDVRTGSAMLAESAKWIANKTIYLGGEDQLPDTWLQNHVSGVGTTPAYPGRAHMVFMDENVTATQGAIPQYRFVVAKEASPHEIGVITAGTVVTTYGTVPVQYYPVQLYKKADGSAAVGTSHQLLNAGMAGTTPFYLHTLADDCTYSSTASAAPVFTDDWDIPSPSPGTIFQRGYGDGGLMVSMDGTIGAGHGACFLSSGSTLRATLKPDASFSDQWWAGFGITPAWQNDGRRIWISSHYVYIGTAQRNSVNVNNLCAWPASASGFPVYASRIVNNICVTPGAEFFTHLGNDDRMRVINDVGEFYTYEADLTVALAGYALPFSITNMHGFGVDGALAVFVYSGVSPHADIRNTSDWSLVATVYDSRFGSTNAENTRVVFTDTSVFIQCQRDIVRLNYQKSTVGIPAVLGDIVADMHVRSGFESADDYDTTELPDLVDGLTITGDYTASDAIATLSACYYFDKAEPGDKLYYPKRGKAVLMTLTIDDLVDVPDLARREQVMELPRKLHLLFQSAVAGYAPAKASFGRSSVDVKSVGEQTLQVPVVLNVDQGQQMVHKKMKVMTADAQGQIKLSIPDRLISLVPSDCIGLSLHEQLRRLRIDGCEWVDGVMTLTCRVDRQSAYTSNLTGIPIPPPTLPPSTLVGSTAFVFADAPSRSDTEDDLHYLVAGVGALPGWYGWALQRSHDAGANYANVDTFQVADVIGTLVDAVPAASEHYTDTTNVVRVQLQRESQVLEDLTEAQFLSEGGAFLLENVNGSYEVMQYRDADDEGSGVFALTTLHRGRLNSGASAHSAGARFVLLEDCKHVPAQSAWIGQLLTHRPVSLGESPELADAETHTYVGRSQLEWPVADLVLSRDMSDVITWSFSARHRFGTDDAPVASSNFRGFRITLDDGVDSITFDTTAQSGTTDASALGAPSTFTVAPINRITGVGPATSGAI